MSPTRARNVTITGCTGELKTGPQTSVLNFKCLIWTARAKAALLYTAVWCAVRIPACLFMKLGSSCIGYLSHPSDQIPIRSNLRKEAYLGSQVSGVHHGGRGMVVGTSILGGRSLWHGLLTSWQMRNQRAEAGTRGHIPFSVHPTYLYCWLDDRPQGPTLTQNSTAS